MKFVSLERRASGYKRIYMHKAALFVASIAVFALGPSLKPAQAQVTAAYSIPAGLLDTALSRFGAVSGVQLLYNSELTKGLRTSGISSSLSPQDALGQLLAGTGLTYRFTGLKSATITRMSEPAAIGSDGSTVLDTITIGGQGSGSGQTEGYIATHDVAATKTDTPLVEVPQAINVVTRDQIEAQGAQTVTEATRYTPGVVAAFGDSDSRNDVQQSRGFFVRYNYNGSRLPYGAYSSAFLRIEPYGLERIDVLKGPSSVMYGQNLPGGLINLSSKRPTETPLREVAIQGGSHGRLQGMFDFSGPIDPEGTLLYRLTGLSRSADGRVDFGYDKRNFIAPSLTWKPTDATSVTFFGHYQKDDTISDYVPLPAAGTLLPNPNGRLPASRYAGEPGFDGYEREQYSFGYNLRHEFENNWILRQNLQFNSVDADTTSSPAFLLDPTQRYLSRVASHGIAGADTFTVDTNLEGKVQTGAVEHQFLLGVDYLNLDDSYKFASNIYEGRFDLYDPVYGQPAPNLIPRIDYQMRRRQLGLYAQDQMRWNDWIVTAGLRHDWVDADSTSNVAGPYNADEKAFTGRIGLTYLFDNGVAPYVSYSTSFDPVDGVSATGGALKPLEGEQIEAGIKYESPDGRTFLTFSTFYLDQENTTAPNPDPTGTGLFQVGAARVQGLEIEVKSELADSLNLIASYAYTHSEITRANPGQEALLGNQLVMVPDHQASLWLDYTLQDGPLAGLGLGGGLRYQGKSYGDAANEFKVGGQVLVDAALNYDFSRIDQRLKGLDLRITGTNLLNEEYVGYCQNALQCFYGQGRTINSTLKYKW